MHVHPNICTIAAFNLKIFIEREQSQAGVGQCDQACTSRVQYLVRCLPCSLLSPGLDLKTVSLSTRLLTVPCETYCLSTVLSPGQWSH